MTEGDDNRYRLLGDEPCCDADDALEFQVIADGVAALIRGSAPSTSLTVGIEGGWGTGKSSLMRLVQARLEGDEPKEPPFESGWKARLTRARRWCGGKLRRWGAACGRAAARAWRWLLAKPQPSGELQVNTVWFNAWTVGNGDALQGLVKSVLNALDRKALRRAARNGHLMGRVRSAVTMGLQLLGFGGVADRLWTVLAAEPEARNQLRGLVDEAVKDWSGDAADGPDGNQMLVVFVDDLDRCTPQNVFQVIEAMKLYLNVPRIVFVIGFDPNAVEHAIQTEKDYSDELRGEFYIEKLIQLRCQIPPVATRQGEELVDWCVRESRIGGAIGETARKAIVKRNGHNPRRIKRFVNSFVVMHMLGQLEGVDDDTAVSVLILNFYFPDFFQLFDGEQNPIRIFLSYQGVREALSSADPVKADTLTKLNELATTFEIDGLDKVQTDREARDRAIARLDAALPEAMRKRSDDRDFTRLARTLADRMDDPKVKRLLRLVPQATESLPSPATSPPRRPLASDLTIAWLTDDRPGATAQMAELKDEVGRLSLVHDLDEARAWLSHTTPDVLILDASRDGQPNAGLGDLERIRRDGAFDGHAIVFAARLNEERVAAARRLNASVTTSWDGLRELLARVKPRATRDPRDDPGSDASAPASS